MSDIGRAPRGRPVPDLKSEREARGGVLVSMLVVCAASLEGDDGDLRLKVEQKLAARMREHAGGRGAFAGSDTWKPFRELAWDAAARLCAADEGEHALKWARVLREILRQLPECDALAN